MPKLDADKASGRKLGTAFIVFGGLIAVAGMIWLARTMMFVRHAAKAPGEIVAMEQSHDSDGGSVYYPVFTFADAGGIVHTQRTSYGSSGFSFKSGDHVTILYDSAAPKHSNIDSFQTVWSFPLIITGFGLLFSGFACFWLFLWTRTSRIKGTDNP